MSHGEAGVHDGPRWQSRVALLAMLMLAMLMVYSMVMVRWGAPWQIAVAVPVLLAAAAVQLVRRVFSTCRPGAGQLARRVLRAVAAEETPGRADHVERPGLR